MAMPNSLSLLQGLPADLAAGQSSGYNFQILSATATAFQAQGTPAAPGKTGIDTCLITQTMQVTCSPTANAQTIQRGMFLRLAALGASQVAGLILQFTDGTSPEVIRAYLARRTTVAEVFHAFDLNNDGKVSLAEITQLASAPAVANSANLFGNFFVMVSNEMALGAGGEKINALPAVQFSQLGSNSLCGNGQPGEGKQAPCAIFPEPDDANQTGREKDDHR